ncbi:hypothetical protein WICANDRAFT_65352 [Wickerhamomyces anomalus NRRL Y-366-8]|uniref:ATP synthase subunit K, mitochondrial n=1 Tax=Wickerhamomyces anomalus (strain ATCC 58044 / CBS 1984 / NCYC 433 / NRRL Y-366-8) TaxID=683960 RepID=A0A1E3NVS0_WICAA|nr:uncharacterized protein WICANDRAFT_65352 [Wickerhamomyces anomalus NRRL Y-366-8]ODQ57090.1 hypothetical protein WICANDRAFT_65352 [Wickerhamomyces anomalus NRRL Y-366-8]
MGSAYVIFGKTVPAHYISIATLSAALLVALPNPFAAAQTTPKINASSPEEEKFINDYLKKAEESEKKEQH